MGNKVPDSFKAAVLEKIQYRPRLTAVFTSTHDIPEQIYDYDNDLFIVYNNVKDKYELHSLQQEVDSYCMTVPFKQLDVRFMRWMWKNDIRVHGNDLMREMDHNEDEYKKMREREQKNWIEAVAKETQSMFAKDAWAGG
jgi:hypothetical protein